MKSPNDLVEGRVYIGAGILGGPDAVDTQFSQTADSYCSAGNWALMSGSKRENLGPDAMICCASEDIGFINDTAEFIAALTEFRGRTNEPYGPD